MIAEAIFDVLSVLVRWIPLRTQMVYSFQQGVRWWFGRDTKLLTKPGLYWYWAWISDITAESVRPKEVETKVQGVTCNGKSRSFSVGCQYEIVDLRLNETCVHDFEDSLLNLIERIAKPIMQDANETDPDKAILTRVRTQTEKWGVKIRFLGLMNDTTSRPLHHFGIDSFAAGSPD